MSLPFQITFASLLFSGACGVACAATTSVAAPVVQRSIEDARVLEVGSLQTVPADCIFFAGGLVAGWREGMRAEVRRGSFTVAELTVVSVSGRVTAALIDSLASDVRIGVGDTVTVKTQRFTN